MKSALTVANKVGSSIGFPAFFIVFGAGISFVLMIVCITAAVLCAFGLDHLYWSARVTHEYTILRVAMAVWFSSWFLLNYFVGRQYISRYSDIAYYSRFKASCYLLIPGATLWLLFFASTFLCNLSSSKPGEWGGLAMGGGLLINVLSQIIEVLHIRKLERLPISERIKIPKSASKLAELESTLNSMKGASSAAQVSALSVSALGLMGLKESAIVLTKSEPVNVLLDVLIANKRHDDADQISRAFFKIADSKAIELKE